MAFAGNAEPRLPQAGAVASILVVDDDPVNCQVVSRRLTQEGFSVATATSGQEALGALDRQRFDLVLLDLAMPDMDGIETLRRLRLHPRGVQTPVIMLSAHDDSDSIKTCLTNGAVDYLVKPLVIPLVRARIERCLRPGTGKAEPEAPQAPAVTRILIVDDDELNCRLLVRQLQNPGYTVTAVNRAGAALELLATDSFDVVLLDVNMPSMNGTVVLKHLRAEPRTRNLPVIMVTATNEVSTMLECIDHGADGYINKPIDIGYLRSCILSAVEARKYGPVLDLG
jgi:CheY-like chemotaxis protein